MFIRRGDLERWWDLQLGPAPVWADRHSVGEWND
jgi:hypothetical protein